MTSHQNHSQFLPKGFRPFSVLVVFVMLAFAGIAFTPLLPFSLFPSGGGSSVYIAFGYPNATAEAVEMNVTAPLEGLLSMVNGVKDVESVSGDGWGQITLTTDKNARIDRVRFQAQAIVREVYPRLPDGVTYPQVSTRTTDQEKQVQLLSYTVSGDMETPALRQLVEDVLQPGLSLVKGVSAIEIYGSNPYEWYVEYDPALLKKHSLNANQLVGAIEQYAYLSGVGVISTHQGRTHSVSLVGKGVSADNWREIIVANTGGRMVRLGQVANITLRERIPDEYFRINGKTALNMVISASKDANQLATANGVFRELEKLAERLPGGVEIIKSYDSTTFLRKELRKNLLRTVFSLAILLLFVVAASRSFRYLAIVTVSLLANLAIAVLFYYLLGIEIHLYSLSGITLSFGLIIDNTLVMVDHLRHRRNMLVFTAVLAATLTTVGALVSIFFLEETKRQNLTDFAWVIIVNLMVSLLIALLMIPALVQRMGLKTQPRRSRVRVLRFKYRLSHAYSRFARLIHRYRKTAITIGFLAVGLPVFLLPERVEGDGFWPGVYNNTLGSGFYKSRMKPLVDKALGGTLRVFCNSVWEKSFWSSPERTKLYVRVQFPNGTTIDQADNLVRLFENRILSNQQVELSIARVSKASASIEILFQPAFESTAFPYTLKSNLESLAITQAGADFSIYGVGLGFSNAISQGFANSRILLTGYSYRQLIDWAKRFADSLGKMPRVDKIWIRGGQQYFFKDIYRKFLTFDESGMLVDGVQTRSFVNELMMLSPGYEQKAWISYQSRRMPLVVQPYMNTTPGDFEFRKTPVRVEGREMKTETWGSVSQLLLDDEIYKENQQYVVTFAYNYIGPDKLVERVCKQQVEYMNSQLPLGFRAEQPVWAFWDWKDRNNYLLILLMVFIIYTVTSVLLESLVQPVAVIALVPISFIGVFITYSMFDLSFDQGTYAAFLLLGGLVVNSAIYVINEQNNLRKRFPHATPASIYIRAVNSKISPILLTVISTVLGLIPFVVLEREPFWFSLAAGTIGGLVFSIPALVVFLPALPGVLGREKSKGGPLNPKTEN
jgi:multidrug efflux pump subunit AcrB